MSNFTESKIPVRASLGKRVVTDLNRDTHQAELGLTVPACKRIDGTVLLEANVWIQDADGRTFGVKMGEEAVRRLHKVLSDAMKEIS